MQKFTLTNLAKYILLIILILNGFIANAQRKSGSANTGSNPSTPPTEQIKKDTIEKKITDTTAAKNATNAAAAKKPKEIKKLDDENLQLSEELVAKIKTMTPNQLVALDQRIVRNEQRIDEYGEKYEATVTVRLGFSQDMITGIVKEVPLYNTTERETNILYVKIPVKFCCTTPIDSAHTKQHCGKMSELNDYEDSMHCKAWVQVEGSTGGSSKSNFGKPIPKGGGVSGRTSPTGGSNEEEGGFGKPVPKDKKKKGKEIQPYTDSVNYRPETPESNKKEDKKDKKGKADSNKNKEDYNEKTAEGNQPTTEGFGKPAPTKDNKKKKGKAPAKTIEDEDNTTVPNQTDSTNSPSTPTPKTITKEDTKAEDAAIKTTNSHSEGTKEEDKKEKDKKAKPTKKTEPIKTETKPEGFGKPTTKDKKKKGKDTKTTEAEDKKEEPLSAADSTQTKKD